MTNCYLPTEPLGSYFAAESFARLDHLKSVSCQTTESMPELVKIAEGIHCWGEGMP
jgi:hypothetical protein